jgi:petrobactin synthase
MTKEQIVDAMFKVLGAKMSNPYLSGFHSDARLREDLALDSSATLQLLVFLELEFGLGLPEEALMNQDLDTVRKVAKLLYDAQERPAATKQLEYEEDIKLHCFVSCLSEVVKRHPGFEHRVLYFGVWDSEVVVNDEFVLSYHSETISHAHFVHWYERLYGIEIWPWYEATRSKEENIAHVTQLVESRSDDQHIMVMLDMYRLPERVNEFNKDPFPHYLMLGTTPNPEDWMIYDPDYRWEGVVKKARIQQAMRSPAVAGGYVFTDKSAHQPNPRQIQAYYEASMLLDRNLMTDAIRRILTAHVEGRDSHGNPLSLAQLGNALDEIPILSIRKYSYEHGFAFFWRELELQESEFDNLCEVIDELAKTFKVIQFQAIKLAATGKRELAAKIFTLLNEQDEREFKIKRRMHEVYNLWCARVIASKPSTFITGVAS